MIPNIIVAVEGKAKSGKSHLALTFPDPIKVFSFDIGIEPIVAKFPNKKIDVVTYEIPILDTLRPKKYAQGIYQSFKTDYEDALNSYKTVVIDTGTHLYEIFRHAYTEEVGQKQLLQVQYGEVYARMSAVLLRPRYCNANLVVTHYQKERWIDDKNTGELELDGYRRTPGLVDIVLRTEMRTRKPDQSELKAGKIRVNEIVVTFEQTRYDALELTGMELINPTYNNLVEVLGWAE